ncbi:Retrotrans gag domain-containing protein [Aphis craccivora]|uniref:Retrotrans gag domain-containing protein n=1 Tax=Aphis craccivora TaxID=307492 RepID=A0A6G0Y2M4_APHCR|nr:Retrotrans gag domain-containing protein [Aphis craccivora]
MDIQSRLQTEIVSVRQTPMQSLTEFFTIKHQLARCINNGQILVQAEPQLVHTIVGLTHSRDRTHIRLQRPNTFADLRQIAAIWTHQTIRRHNRSRNRNTANADIHAHRASHTRRDHGTVRPEGRYRATRAGTVEGRTLIVTAPRTHRLRETPGESAEICPHRRLHHTHTLTHANTTNFRQHRRRYNHQTRIDTLGVITYKAVPGGGLGVQTPPPRNFFVLYYVVVK